MLIDTLWVFLAAILVFFMNLGFASVEAGFARSKNTVNILSKNFIVFAISSLGFLLLGWGLMFGGDNPIIGTENLWILGNADLSAYDDTLTSSVPFWGKFFFQLVFCGTAATIVSGAVAERIKYISFIIFSFILTLFIYPVVGHWVWGGGWLADLGFKDFAGDTVVHSVGGWAALSGALILGPRIGKYDKNGKPRAIPGHNMSLAVIGLFVLWLGWFGFNPGSTMSFQNTSDIMHILMTTNTSAIAAVVTSTVTAWIFIGKPDLGMTINGCLAGLVAVTGGCAYVSIEISLLIGAIAGVVVVFAAITAICEKTGFLSNVIKLSIAKVDGAMVVFLLAFVSVVSKMAGDICQILMPILGAALFYQIGRHPLAGAFCAYAGSSAGFATCLIPSSTEVINTGITITCAQVLDPDFTMPVLASYYVLLVNCFVISIITTIVTI